MVGLYSTILKQNSIDIIYYTLIKLQDLMHIDTYIFTKTCTVLYFRTNKLLLTLEIAKMKSML